MCALVPLNDRFRVNAVAVEGHTHKEPKPCPCGQLRLFSIIFGLTLSGIVTVTVVFPLMRRSRNPFLTKMKDLMAFLLPRYQAEGKSGLLLLDEADTWPHNAWSKSAAAAWKSLTM